MKNFTVDINYCTFALTPAHSSTSVEINFDNNFFFAIETMLQITMWTSYGPNENSNGFSYWNSFIAHFQQWMMMMMITVYAMVCCGNQDNHDLASYKMWRKLRGNKADLTMDHHDEMEIDSSSGIHFKSKTHFDMIVDLFHNIQIKYLIVWILFELSFSVDCLLFIIY